MKKYQYAFLTEKGRRETNQDNVAVFTDKSTNAYLVVVADGMGGYKGGETASNIVIEAAQEVFKKARKSLSNKKKLKLIVQLIFDAAQQKIKDYIAQNPELSGMGTTMVCLLVVNGVAVWGNIGDSRAYIRIAETDPKQITRDHSLVQDYMDKNGGNVPVNYLNQYSNIITRSIAGSNDKIDIFPMDSDYLEIEDDFTFLLCTDGLILDKSYDYSYFLFDTIEKNATLEEAVTNLFNWAYDSGSTDNISIAILKNKKSHKRITNVISPLIILSLFLILLMLGLTAYYYSGSEFSKTKPVVTHNSSGKQIVSNQDLKTKEQWQGFKTTDTLNYYLKRNNGLWSLDWNEYKGSLVAYILKVVNINDPKKVALELNNIKVAHITVGDLEDYKKQLKPGTYKIELFVKTNNGDTLKASNNVILNVK